MITPAEHQLVTLAGDKLLPVWLRISQMTMPLCMAGEWVVHLGRSDDPSAALIY